MRVRKILTKIGNLIYIAGAGFAIYGMVTQPLIHLNLGITLTGEDIKNLIPSDQSEGGGDTGGSGDSTEYMFKTLKREGAAPSMEDMLKPEKIAEYIPEIKLNVALDVPASVCFDLNNPSALGELVTSSIDSIVDSAVDQLTPVLTSVIANVASDVASSMIEEALIQNLAGGAAVTIPDGTKEILSDTLSDVFGLLTSDSDEPVLAETFIDTLITGGEKADQVVSEPFTVEGLEVTAKEKSSEQDLAKIKSIEFTDDFLTYNSYRIGETVRFEGLKVIAKDDQDQPVEIKNGDYRLSSTKVAVDGESYKDVVVTAELISNNNIKNTKTISVVSADATEKTNKIVVKEESESTTGFDTCTIAIGGNVTKTKYYNGDKLCFDGLTVTADGDLDLEDGDYEFVADPERLATGATQASVVAKLVHTGTYKSGVLGFIQSLKDNEVAGFEALAELDVENMDVDEIGDGIMKFLTNPEFGLASTDPETGEVVLNNLTDALGTLLAQFMGGDETTDVSKMTSIAIEGDLTNKNYFVDDVFTGEGLSVVGYNEGSADPVQLKPADYTLSFNPGIATLGTTSVEVTATLKNKDLTSEPKTITGITVTEAPVEAPVRTVTRDETPADADPTAMIKDMLKGFIPDLSTVDFTFGGLTPYILLGVIALGCLPWALFALFTFVRTLRPRKCWAKPWFIFVFCFLELILGAGLYFGLTYGLQLALPMAGGMIPAEYAGLLGGLSLEFKMSCYYASLVYLAMIPFTIIYAIFAHGPKKEFKIYKKAKGYAKRIAKGKLTIDQVKEKYREETSKILEKKYKIAA